MRRRVAAAIALLMIASAASAQAPAQHSPAPSRLGHGPDTIPDLTNRLIAVYGERPLADSALVMLARRGLRVADRNPQAIAAAARERRRMDPAQMAVLVEVRYDSMARARIFVASLLDVVSLRRLRLTSVLVPEGRVWGQAMDTVLTQLLKRGGP